MKPENRALGTRVEGFQTNPAGRLPVLTGSNGADASKAENWSEYVYENAGEGVQRDEVMRSCGIAGQTLMLAAKAMGLSRFGSSIWQT